MGHSELRSSFQYPCSRPTGRVRPTTQRPYISHAARGVPACHIGRYTRPTANDNSPFHFDQELGESAGLYKPAVPNPQHHTWAYTSAATSAKPGPPSPSRNLAASSAGDRSRTGIIYPLQPRSKHPDVCIEVEATLPEPAALLRPDLQQQLTREAPTSLSRPSRRHCRKRRRNSSTVIYRPAKRSPPRVHWCEI